MVAALFRDPNLSVAVLWGPGGATPSVSLRAVRRMPDATLEFGQSRGRMPTLRLDFRVSDAGALASGDLVSIGGATWRVSAAPELDSEGLVLSAEMRPA